LNNVFTGTAAPPPDVPLIWPPATAPTLKIVSINNTTIAGAPKNTHIYIAPDLFVPSSADSTYTVTIQATNMPITWAVTVRVVPRREGTEQIIAATMQDGGTQDASTWTASFSCAPQNVADISVRASAQ